MVRKKRNKDFNQIMFVAAANDLPESKGFLIGGYFNWILCIRKIYLLRIAKICLFL
jgi:hypothetical protein